VTFPRNGPRCCLSCKSSQFGRERHIGRMITARRITAHLHFRVEAKGLEPSNLLTASQALYQLSYAPEGNLTLPAGR
jgi:hypothetical protein